MEVSKQTAHSEHKNSETDSLNDQEDVSLRFHKSLQELRVFRSQLHYAADYCESTFLNTEKKKIVVDNTKEYICRAMVALVDHLGGVSNNLNSSISKTNDFSDAEIRINSLKQRLLSCEQYAHKLAIRKVQWNPSFPRFHSRYLSPPNASAEKLNRDERNCMFSSTKSAVTDKNVFNTEDLPLFLYTQTQKSSSVKSSTEEGNMENFNSKHNITKTLNQFPNSIHCSSSPFAALPVRDGIWVYTKRPNSTFHFQHCSSRRGRNILFRKYVNSNDLLSIIRRTKRTT